jgi:hypothetical protein
LMFSVTAMPINGYGRMKGNTFISEIFPGLRPQNLLAVSRRNKKPRRSRGFPKRRERGLSATRPW